MTIHRKRLEGVTATHSLLSLYDECLSLAKTEPTKPLLTTVSTDSSEASPATRSGAPTTTTSMLLPPLRLDDARLVLVEFDKQQWSSAETQKPPCLPIRVIRAMKVLLQNDATVAKLEEALGQTQLHFTPPPPVVNKDAHDAREQRDWQKRMERLRLQNEETNYYKMTSNVSTQSKKDDDITTKSMTYAASVGLNMIVAPISFGVFMYFFSGPVLNFCWRNFTVQPGGVDIRRVIIGVISGVAMLFIEMLLFVIRTHEMDRQMLKNRKKKGTSVKPFGEYSSAMEKKFVKAD